MHGSPVARRPKPLAIDLVELARSGRSEETRQAFRRIAFTSLYFFAKIVLKYQEMTDDLHRPLCEWIENTRTIQRRGVLLPRRHFKSTIVSKSYSLWRLLPLNPEDSWFLELEPEERQWLHDFHDPNKRVLIVGESDGVAAKNLNDIKDNILSNALLQWLFPEIIPQEIGKTRWTTSEILLPRTRSFDESSITTMGVGAKGTGFHYDLIIYDDLIGEKSAHSEAEMESAKDWFRAAPGLYNDPKTVEELMPGTRWKYGRADLYGWIQDEMPEGTPGGFTWYIRSAIEQNAEGRDVLIFPERFTFEILESERKRMGDYLFNCNMMNRPTMPEGGDFQESWVKTYRLNEDRRTLLPEDDSGTVTALDLVRVSFYDPSSGGTSARAENAIIVAGMDYRRRVFVLEAWSKNCGYGHAIENWHDINDRLKCWRNLFEDVGSQKEILEIVNMRANPCQFQKRWQKGSGEVCGKTHRPLKPVPHRPPGGSQNKEERIRMLAQAAFEERRVYIDYRMEKLRKQILEFPHGELVDLLDALAYCISQLRPPLSEDTIREERRRADERRQRHHARTATGVDYGGYS